MTCCVRLKNNRKLIELLLEDHNTKGSIIWATDEYASTFGFSATDPVRYLHVQDGHTIRPRIYKSSSEQRTRSRDMAEVFTPAWIVNKQNNLVDEAWFGRPNVFNVPTGRTWEPTAHTGLTEEQWKGYVLSTRLEVSCGEAPYLTTRYDAVDGSEVPVPSRVGLLDRKLRLISEYVPIPEQWEEWALKAVKSVYGYDFQGDNIFLARKNLLLTVLEHYHDRFGGQLSDDRMSDIAEVISWNIWQMDGLTGCVPLLTKAVCDIYGMEGSAPIRCHIMDWANKRPEPFPLPEEKKTAETSAKTKGPSCRTAAANNTNKCLDAWIS